MSNDHELMSIAARAALRGMGCVEPNPIVGCLIASKKGQILGIGHHALYGGPHAEVDAIKNARARGHDPRGATMFVTLEPCAHTGKTPPCVDAILDAGLSRVVIARPDPNGIAAGGANALRGAGVKVELREHRDLAWWVGEPFAQFQRTGLPWTIAKWAQTLDGAIATRTGDSKWISSEASRRHVHRVRGRVGAILTGIGTVLADDPMLTARGVPARRVPVRAVIDPELRIPLDSKLVATADRVTTVVYCNESEGTPAHDVKRAALDAVGVRVVGMPPGPRGISVRDVLLELASAHGVTSVIIESGPGLLTRAIKENVVNEALVFVAPKLISDESSIRASAGMQVDRIADSTELRFWRVRQRGGDAVLRAIIDR